MRFARKVSSRHPLQARPRACRVTFFALLVLVMLAATVEAKVGFQKIEVEGRGKTVASATTDALKRAVQRVNGRSIQAADVVLQLEGVLGIDGEEVDITADLLLSTVVNQTRGGIKTFEVLSKTQEESTWIVKVLATVARYEARVESKRMSIAVFPLELSSHPFKVLEEPIDKNRFERLMNQALVSYLVQTRKFTVLDRNHLAEALGETSIIESGNTPPEEMAKLGQQLSADFVLVGTIEDVQMKEEERQLRAANRVLKSLSGSVEFSYRLINVPTRQVFLSDRFAAQYGAEDLKDPSDVYTRLIKLASQDLGEQILYSIYPVRIERIAGDEVIIGQGGNSMREGDEYEIYELGDEIVDSYTKESLGKIEKRVGLIRISRVTSSMATGKILESNIDLAAEFAAKKFIIRPPREKRIDPQKLEDLKVDIREKRKERDMKHQDDW